MPMCAGQLKGDSLQDINNATAADLAPLDTAFWCKQQEELSSQGLRVLALCRCVLPPVHNMFQCTMASSSSPQRSQACIIGTEGC